MKGITGITRNQFGLNIKLQKRSFSEIFVFLDNTFEN